MIRSKIPYYTWLLDSVRLLLTTTISQTFLVFDDLDSFEKYCQTFFRISFNWDLSDIFLIINLGSTYTGILNPELTAVSYHFMIFDSFLRKIEWKLDFLQSIPFAAIWMDLEIIILSEVSQIERDKYHMISLIYGTYNMTQMNLLAKQK